MSIQPRPLVMAAALFASVLTTGCDDEEIVRVPGPVTEVEVPVEVPAANDAPVAMADTVVVTTNSAQNLLDVLGNDTDADDDNLVISAVGDADDGTVEIINGTRINYRPVAGFSGTDGFTYTVADGRGGSDTATVTVSPGARCRGGSLVKPTPSGVPDPQPAPINTQAAQSCAKKVAQTSVWQKLMRTGEDDGAREEGGPLGEEGDELRDGEDHVGGVGRLHHLAVHRAAQLQRCAQQRTLVQSGQQQRAEGGDGSGLRGGWTACARAWRVGLPHN